MVWVVWEAAAPNIVSFTVRQVTRNRPNCRVKIFFTRFYVFAGQKTKAPIICQLGILVSKSYWGVTALCFFFFFLLLLLSEKLRAPTPNLSSAKHANFLALPTVVCANFGTWVDIVVKSFIF